MYFKSLTAQFNSSAVPVSELNLKTKAIPPIKPTTLISFTNSIVNFMVFLTFRWMLQSVNCSVDGREKELPISYWFLNLLPETLENHID